MARAKKPLPKQNKERTVTVKLKEQVIEYLSKNSIVQVACEKAGVPRSTYYKWRQEDRSFAEKADQAIFTGTERINDMAESQLLRKIQEGHMTAIIFWLKNHKQGYATRILHEFKDNREIDPQLLELVEKSFKGLMSDYYKVHPNAKKEFINDSDNP